MRFSFSDIVGVLGMILGVVLIVLDKAGKLKGPWLFVLLSVAGLMTFSIAIDNVWIMGAPQEWKIWRIGLMICLVIFVYSGLGIWISPHLSPEKQVKTVETTPVPIPGNRAAPTSEEGMATKVLPRSPALEPHHPEKTTTSGQRASLPNRAALLGPDLSAKLVYGDLPALMFVNKSDNTVKGPSVLLQTWNLDKPYDQSLINIPISLDPNSYIKGGSYMVPLTFMGRPDVSSRVKSGDRIVGWMSVTCPDCIKTRAYWFYLVYGVGGWYAECPEGQYPNINSISQHWSLFEKLGDKALDGTIPTILRIPITDDVP